MFQTTNQIMSSQIARHSTTLLHQATQDASDVVVPGTLRENHLVFQVPQQPRQVGGVHILKVLRKPRRTEVEVKHEDITDRTYEGILQLVSPLKIASWSVHGLVKQTANGWRRYTTWSPLIVQPRGVIVVALCPVHVEGCHILGTYLQHENGMLGMWMAWTIRPTGSTLEAKNWMVNIGHRCWISSTPTKTKYHSNTLHLQPSHLCLSSHRSLVNRSEQVRGITTHRCPTGWLGRPYCDQFQETSRTHLHTWGLTWWYRPHNQVPKLGW